MSFDWLEYLTLAQELANQAINSSNQEARLRCAISRAYYAAFCKARNHLRYKEQRSFPNSGRVHQTVIETFEKSHDPVHQIVGQFLRNLRANRNIADYEDIVIDLPGITRGTLVQAEQVISLLSTL